MICDMLEPLLLAKGVTVYKFSGWVSTLCRYIFLGLVMTGTPLKTNMSPENPWLEDVFPTEIVHF